MKRITEFKTFSTVMLTGKENYSTWAFAVKEHLKTAGIIRFIESETILDKAESEAKTQDDSENKRHQEAKFIIIATLSEKEMANIIHCDTAFQIWQHFKNSYGKKCSNEKLELLNNLHKFHCSQASEVPQTINKILTIVGKLKTFDIVLDETMIISSIMNSLPETFKSFLDQWLMFDIETQTLQRFIDRLTERSKALADDEAPNTALAATKFPVRGNSQLNKAPRFQNRTRNSTHPVSNLMNPGPSRPPNQTQNRENSRWTNVPNKYPQQQTDTSDSSGANMVTKVCNYCHHAGHWKSECRKLQRRMQEISSQKESENSNKPNFTGNAYMAIQQSGILKDNSKAWIADSGASSHMTPNKSWLRKYVEFAEPKYIRLGDGHILHALGTGVVQTSDGFISDVHFVPELQANLYSISAAVERGLEIRGTKVGMSFYRGNKEILRACRSGGTFIIEFDIIYPPSNEIALTAGTLEDWHRRLGHMPKELISKMINLDVVDGLRIVNEQKDQCLDCQLNKCVRKSHKSRTTRKAIKSGHHLHLDWMHAPEICPSIRGEKYILTAKDEFSGFRIARFLKQKSEIQDSVKLFINQTEFQTENNVLMITTDNAQEFLGERLAIFLQQKGIVHNLSAPYVPQQNGTVERDNRILTNQSRTILNASKLPKSLWSEAMATATYVYNRSISPNRLVTPYELWFGKRPNINNLKVFGEQAVVMKPSRNRSKFDEKATLMNFVGYTDNYHTYKFFDPKSGKIEVSCDAYFTNKIGPIELVDNPQGNNKTINPIIDTIITEETLEESRSHDNAQETHNNDNQEISNNSEILYQNQVTHETSQNNVQGTQNNNIQDISNNSEIFNHNQAAIQRSQSVENINNLTRTIESNSPSNYPNIQIEPIQQNSIPNSSAPRSFFISSGFVNDRPRRNVPPRNYASLSKGKDDMRLCLAQLQTPRNLEQALSGSEKDSWAEAISDEMNAMINKGVFELVYPPAGANIISCRWVLTIKTDPNGKTKRKARLVARGFTQRYGVDYFSTFSPVAPITTIRYIFSLVASRNLKMKQFDIRTAFLNGDLNEDIYMHQPEGFNDNSGRVWHLKKSLYGLKQAPKAWNDKITKFLSSKLGLMQSEDDCIFIRKIPFTILILYVDDGIIIAEDPVHIDQIIQELNKEFEVSIITKNKFLGLQYIKNDNYLFIYQKDYIDDIVQRFGMSDANIAPTPVEPGQLALGSPPLPNNYLYSEAVGALQYLSSQTRMDIAYTVHYLSRQVKHPTENDWNILKRCIRYLKGTSNLGIIYKRNNSLDISVFTDADYAGDKKTYKSTSGIVIMAGSSPISWRSRLQKHASTSTSESELLAISDGIKDVICVKKLSETLDHNSQNKAINLFCDNRGAVLISNNEMSSQRTRHLGAHLAFVREQNNNGTINVQSISKNNQLADWLTKPLKTQKFVANRVLLMTALILSLVCLSSANNITYLSPETLGAEIGSAIIWTKQETKIESGRDTLTLSFVIKHPCVTINATRDSYPSESIYSKIFIKLASKCQNTFVTEYLPAIEKLLEACNHFVLKTTTRNRYPREADAASSWLGSIPVVGNTGYNLGQYYNDNSAYNTVWRNEKSITDIKLKIASINKSLSMQIKINAENSGVVRELVDMSANNSASINQLLETIPEVAWTSADIITFIKDRTRSFDRIRKSINEKHIDTEELYRITKFDIIKNIDTTDTELKMIHGSHQQLDIIFTIPIIDEDTNLYEAMSIPTWLTEDSIVLYQGPNFAIYNQSSNCSQIQSIHDSPRSLITSCIHENESISEVVSSHLKEKTLTLEEIEIFRKPVIIRQDFEMIIQCYGLELSNKTHRVRCPKHPISVSSFTPLRKFSLNHFNYHEKETSLRLEGTTPQALNFKISNDDISRKRDKLMKKINKIDSDNSLIFRNLSLMKIGDLDLTPSELGSSTIIIIIIFIMVIFYLLRKKSPLEKVIEAQLAMTLSTSDKRLTQSSPNINISFCNQDSIYPNIAELPSAPTIRKATPYPSIRTLLESCSYLGSTISRLSNLSKSANTKELPYNALPRRILKRARFESTLSLPDTLRT